MKPSPQLAIRQLVVHWPVSEFSAPRSHSSPMSTTPSPQVPPVVVLMSPSPSPVVTEVLDSVPRSPSPSPIIVVVGAKVVELLSGSPAGHPSSVKVESKTSE